MGYSARLFGRQRTLHQILGGGFVADVILWRRRDVTVGLLTGALVAWALFRFSGYTLLSLLSNVLLLLFSILFVWAKCAEILNRPPPPIPELYLPREITYEAVIFLHSKVNAVLSGSYDIALGKNPKLFHRVAVCLTLVSVVGNHADFLTFAYSSLAILLTMPALYEKYEDTIDRFVTLALIKLHMYELVYEECFRRAREWIIEELKES